MGPYNQGVDECIYGNHPATLTEAAAATPDFSTLVAALDASGLINAFDDISQKVTVFAPTNAAFDALFAATNTTAEQILGQTDFLQKVLKYHVVGDVMPYADLTDGATMPTLLEGASLGASAATSDSRRGQQRDRRARKRVDLPGCHSSHRRRPPPFRCHLWIEQVSKRWMEGTGT